MKNKANKRLLNITKLSKIFLKRFGEYKINFGLRIDYLLNV